DRDHDHADDRGCEHETGSHGRQYQRWAPARSTRSGRGVGRWLPELEVRALVVDALGEDAVVPLVGLPGGAARLADTGEGSRHVVDLVAVRHAVGVGRMLLDGAAPHPAP